MKKIILDTNFLLIPYQFKVDIFSEIDRILDTKYNICILNKTINELNNLVEKSRGKDKKAAQLALKLIQHKNPEIIKTKINYVDKAILNIAKKQTHIIATQDKELKKTLQARGIPIIVLRQKRYLQLKQT
ncbi:hypothetical protein A3K72_02350 [Candidatus Woesearchaeota archaeon RBG_13_36_6]|nr:MAG: hypothetical protein A3K72_02350 [Candidatus Woesearchaeota archaeon RBG_13_36_6]